MILDRVEKLASFPYEHIGVFVNPNVEPQANIRMGIKVRSNDWEYNRPNLKWTADSWKRAGEVSELLNSPTLSSYYDTDLTGEYFQTGTHIDLPDTFPLFYETFEIPNHHLILQFRAGASALSVFPEAPYPKISSLGNNIITVSGCKLPLTGLEGDLSISEFRRDYVNPDDLEELDLCNIYAHTHNYTGPSGTVYQMWDDFYLSPSRESYVIQTQANNSPTRVINNKILTNQKIIPETFSLTFPVSCASAELPFIYTASYWKTQNVASVQYHFLTGGDVEEFGQILNQATLSNPGKIHAIDLKNGFFVPKGGEIIASYQVSSLPYIESTNPALFVHGVSAASSNNFFTISSQESPYFYNYKFYTNYDDNSIQDTDAFTIHYHPEINIEQNESSSVNASITMIDNFYQTELSIDDPSSKIKWKYSEEIHDPSLSAMDLGTGQIYTENQWMPASAEVKFFGDGRANRYLLTPTVSSFQDDIWYPDDFSFILNKENADINLQASSTGPNFTIVNANIFPNFDSTKLVKWNVEPADNIRLYHNFGELQLENDGISIIPEIANEFQINETVSANSLSIIVDNLGVLPTKISLSSEEYETSAFTIWYPVKESFDNLRLQLSAETDDYHRVQEIALSAFYVKNEMLYPAPESGSILWKETNNDPRGESELYTKDYETRIFENASYPLIKKTSVINSKIDMDEATSSPRNIVYLYKALCNGQKPNSDETYSIEDGISISLRQYPANVGITASLTSSNGDVFTTDSISNYIVNDSSVTVSAEAITADFRSITELVWNIEGITSTGPTAEFTLAGSSICFDISALSAAPVNTNFGEYHFSDSYCLYKIGTNYPEMDYIAFPKNMYFPLRALGIDDDSSYLFSEGLTGLNGCINTVEISATEGFDKYEYFVGDVSALSNSHTIILTANNDGPVVVNGYNNIFPKENSLSVYNSISSDNTTYLKEDYLNIEITAFPTTLTLTDTLFNVRDNDSASFFIDTSFSGIETLNEYKIAVSGDGYINYSDIVSSDVIDGRVQFYTDADRFPSIKRNTYNLLNIALVGNIHKKVDGSSCSYSQVFSTNWIPVTAFDGPDLELFYPRNIFTTGETVSAINVTQEFPNSYTNFIFDDGNGNITSGYSYQDTITASYNTDGIYSQSLTGIGPESSASYTWEDVIVIKSSFEEYDATVDRIFPEDVKLPNSCKDIEILPNSWQWKENVNSSISSVMKNISSLTSDCFSWSINNPKHNIGYILEDRGNLRWKYTNNFATENTLLSNYIGFIEIDNNLLFFTKDKIKVVKNDYKLTTIKTFTKITDGEKFNNIKSMCYIPETNKLLVVDGNNIYVFDYSTTNISLTHYWGGEGTVTSKSEINNPTDSISLNGNIYITDSDSNNIKIYNKYLNWIDSLSYVGWSENNKPVSTAIMDGKYYVITTNGDIDIFETSTKAHIKSIKSVIGIKIRKNPDSEDFLQIISDGFIYNLDSNGKIYSKWQCGSAKELIFQNKEIFILTDKTLEKYINYIESGSVLTSEPTFADLNSFNIVQDEFNSSFVWNDVFVKLHQNCLALHEQISKKFTTYLDENENFHHYSVEPITLDEIHILEPMQLLGNNEIVSWETINRNFSIICGNLEKLRKMVDVRISRTDSSFCWTWKNLRIDNSQNLSSNKRPYSFVEIDSEALTHSSELSSLSWKDARNTGCGYESNHMPICWTWENMSCNCIWPVSWDQMECDEYLHKTWEELEESCCAVPVKRFDNCIEK